ncbi:hypothetical protein D9M71_534870 [compost metagenome]
MEELPGAMNLADTLGQGLALFPRQLLAQFGLACDQLVADGHEHLVALFQPAARPDGLGGSGRGDGLVHLAGIGLGVMAHDVLDVRWAPVGNARAAFYPGAIDVVAEDLAGHVHLRSRFERMVGATSDKLKLVVNIG